MAALGQVPRVESKKKKKKEKKKDEDVDDGDDDVKTELVAEEVKPLYTGEELEKMSSKERRSAKRKMEAIAAESKGVDVAVFREEKKEQEEMEEAKAKAKGAEEEEEEEEGDKGDDRKKVNPYIVFVGQLNFKTTEKDLSEHVKKNVSKVRIEVSQASGPRIWGETTLTRYKIGLLCCRTSSHPHPPSTT